MVPSRALDCRQSYLTPVETVSGANAVREWPGTETALGYCPDAIATCEPSVQAESGRGITMGSLCRKQIPVEVIFNPKWWFCNYGISFDRSFYLDREVRIENDVIMRRAMHERFGLGETDPEPRPIIGSMHVAGGCVMPALFGVTTRFAPDAAPDWVPSNLSREEVLELEVPDLERTWPMDHLTKDIAGLEEEFGYVVGDFDTDGILTTALLVRGQQLYLDLHEDEHLVRHLFGVLARTYAGVAGLTKSRTGSCAIATNRSILNVDPAIYLHSNCSVQMVSPATYEELLLPYELFLAERLQPYGIHHCGNRLHLYAEAYSQVPAVFFDVGWGSDVAKCREAFPEAFLNLRLDPVRMLQLTPDEIHTDTAHLLRAGGPLGRVGICCINMDHGTPDENVMAMLDAAAGFSCDIS